ncbi:acyltransferase [Aliivibrio fischeri]|uniref:acyltransferase n=1 Tax=Aliivibrio fischeri TaxID=668 RepID=UPI00080E533A|nr:acyltransferase [Aliivibrio fischeri]OCH04138.1 hypothetical protein A6E10_02375 [Aliivibrio fischeri]
MFFILKVLFLFFPLLSKNEFFLNFYSKYEIREYLKKGCKIGNKTRLYRVTLSSSFKGDKFFIGDNCTLTNCILLGHDASPSLYIKELINNDNYYLPGSRTSYRSPIIIGNNVFIGYGSIILPGVNIGDNVVIAAGSIVINDIPSDGVYAGNPAKYIKSINSFVDKYKILLKEKPEFF